MKKRTRIIIGSSLFVIVVAAVTWTIVAGYLYAGIKRPSQEITVRQRACGDEIIKEYNKLADSYAPASVMSDLVDKVQKLDGYDQDPTCLFIAYSYGTSSDVRKDNSEMRALYDKIVSLSDKGVYIDSRISNIYSVSKMESALDYSNNR